MMLLNKHYNQRKKAFTLVELLVVIAIIGLLATISVIALSQAREKSRDAKRVADIKQIQTALELFFNDMGRYPSASEWSSGSLYSTTTGVTTTYMASIPEAPISGNCNNTYTYAPNSTGDNYTINFCLEEATGDLDSGLNIARAGGNKDESLVGWWILDTEHGGSDLSGYDNNGVAYGGLDFGNYENYAT